MTAQRGIALAGALVMLGFSARQLVWRGIGPAKTIASRSGLSPRDSEAALLLLARAREVLPRGARVVFADARRPGGRGVAQSVAVGQLPRQDVLPYEELDRADYFLLLNGQPDEQWVAVEPGVYKRR